MNHVRQQEHRFASRRYCFRSSTSWTIACVDAVKRRCSTDKPSAMNIVPKSDRNHQNTWNENAKKYFAALPIASISMKIREAPKKKLARLCFFSKLQSALFYSEGIGDVFEKHASTSHPPSTCLHPTVWCLRTTWSTFPVFAETINYLGHFIRSRKSKSGESTIDVIGELQKKLCRKYNHFSNEILSSDEFSTTSRVWPHL